MTNEPDMSSTRRPDASRRPTMADIARHLGVSRPLVSIVLRGADGASDATRRRVLTAAAELGYRPDPLAQGLRSKRTRRLGVIFGLRRPFEVEFVEHMFPVVDTLGYHLLLGATGPNRDQESVIEELLGYRCEAVVVVGRERSHRLEVPVVEIGHAASRGSVDVIRNDDALGTRQAVDHLVSLGHRAIAFIGGGANPGAEERQAGYHDAMRGHGLEQQVRLIDGGYTERHGAEAAHLLLAEGLPTAIIASNDLAAIGVLDTLLRAGRRVPDEVSVVGYDDSRFAPLPGIDLTSVRQDIPRMAELAVRTAVAQLDKRSRPPTEVALAPRLVVRGTTAAPRAETTV